MIKITAEIVHFSHLTHWKWIVKSSIVSWDVFQKRCSWLSRNSWWWPHIAEIWSNTFL